MRRRDWLLLAIAAAGDDELPAPVRRDIEALNNLRNGLAHTLFPENLRPARPEWKGQGIFTVAGLGRFTEETQGVIDALMLRFYGVRVRGQQQVGTRRP
jgi:hypothetical protein